MPRPKPDPKAVVPHIIAQAITLLKKQGFEQLTMKSLAQQCDMSVGKLYHFFPGKDDLFLTLEIEYFEGLYRALDDAASQYSDATQAFRAMLSAYYHYAAEHIELYQLVSAPPKVYTHYLGTTKEALARLELKSALSVVNLVRRYFDRVAKKCALSVGDSDFLFCINAMHGLILMSHSAAWPYVSRRVESELDLDAPPGALHEEVEQQIDLLLNKLLH